VIVTIIDYGSGNLHSAAKAFERAAREQGIDAQITVTAEADIVRTADQIVLPGVGAFADCRAGLDAVPGMVAALQEMVITRGRPFLGICVGAQLMATRGLEKAETPGFDWIGGDVVALEPNDLTLRIPHMGWNGIDALIDHPLLAGIPIGRADNALDAYFVHSYHLVPRDRGHLIATADYGGPVSAIVGRDNMVGTQFHPEKSQQLGLGLIGNFLNWRP